VGEHGEARGRGRHGGYDPTAPMSLPIPVLLVAHQLPPVVGPGSRRPAAWSRTWPRHGVEPVVVSGRPEDVKRLHGYPVGRDEAPSGALLVPTPEPSGLAGLLRRAGVPPRLVWTLGYRRVREPETPWVGPAIEVGLLRASKAGVRAVVSTSQPYAAHTVGRAIARALDVPWIADFRDPMTEAEGRVWPSRLHWWAERREERGLLRDADLVWVTSAALADRWRALHPDVAARLRLRRNGLGPVDVASLPPPPPLPPLVLGHVGRFTDSPRRSRLDRLSFRPGGPSGDGSSAAPLFAALERLLARRQDLAGRIVWRTVGSDASGPVPDGVVRDAHGPVSPAEAFALAAGCHALYLPLTRPSRFGTQFVQQKVYEYAALRRPVLVTGTRREATELLGDACWLAAPDDPETLSRHIEALAGGGGLDIPIDVPAPPWEDETAAACAADLLEVIRARGRVETPRRDAPRAPRG
jgi:glycosyltransferase involved in cell wall biosynthesis